MAEWHLVTDENEQAEAGGPLDEYEGAAAIAAFLRSTAARMPRASEGRALALGQADRWRTIAGCRPVSLTTPPPAPRRGQP